MRFAEKSFEVRFCAALSAALMPFNRNPQWFGMTQAQERINGIDTMVRVGGRLIMFQFKAKQAEKFKLEKPQWRNLDRIARRYPDSTYYVFPEAGDVSAAASVACILAHSWCSSVPQLGRTFKTGAASTTLSLNKNHGILSKSRPRISVRVDRTCQTIGCFCPPSAQQFVDGFRRSGIIKFTWAGRRIFDVDSDSSVPSGESNFVGIPLGDVPYEDDTRPVNSSGEFEQMLDTLAGANLRPGLSGLFLPHTRNRD